MAAWRKGARYDGPLLVVFGGRDGISRPEDLWPTGKSGRVVVLPTAGHATVLSLAAPTINSWIADTAQ
jgi:pimeloyl-ACP methyl ester carboxylesterase